MSNATPSISPVTTEVHYWETVVFLVEGSCFKVPKYHFMKSSEIFQSMFSLPQSGENVEGTDTNPITLDGVKAVDFRRLLDILYPSKVPWYTSDLHTKEEWQSILKLATLWRFLHLRKLAIDMLTRWSSMDAVERIILGREFSVSDWIQTGYTTLVTRSEALTMEEVEIIGYGHAIQVFRAREEARKSKGQCNYCGRRTGDCVSSSQAQTVVQTEFAAEIAQASCDGAEYSVPSRPPSSLGSPILYTEIGIRD